MLVTVLLQLAFPKALSSIVDAVKARDGFSLDATTIIIVAAILIVQPVASAFRYYLFEITGCMVAIRIRRLLFEALVLKSIAFFDEHRVGELASRLSIDTEAVHDSLMLALALALRSFCVLFGGLAMLISMSPMLSLLLLVFCPLTLLLSSFAGRSLRDRAVSVQSMHAECNNIALQRLTNIRLVQAANQQRSSIACYRHRLDSALASERANAKTGAWFSGGSALLQYLSSIAMLFGGVHLIAQGALSVGELAAFVLYANMVTEAASSLSGVWTDWMRAIGTTDRVFELMSSWKPETRYDHELLLKGQVTFRGVTFSYPQRNGKAALDDVSFDAFPGEKIALVGPSGSGKSTVANLLLGFYKPERGRIELDGVDAALLDMHAIRENIAIVEQDPQLFADSILHNITFSVAERDVPLSEVVAAAKLANIHEFIESLPEGYQTLVGDRGVQLSGGQKQRIAVARAVLRNPRILILDEATSALDSATERQVQASLNALMKGRTAIVIAHRYATVADADRIVVLDEGRVVQQGSHDCLMRQTTGLYHQLVRNHLRSDSTFADFNFA